MISARWELVAAVALDLVLGDPAWLPHPVRGFGWLSARVEASLRRSGIPLRAAGVMHWFFCVGIACALVKATLPWAAIWWTWTFLAMRDLDRQAGTVVDAVRSGNLPAARDHLSMIVGRDTAHLDEPEILRATYETVAENLCDGVIAPLFFLGLAGVVGMAAYKSINTLDSMIGYRNRKYREYGWFSARVDDVANYIPARLTAVLIWVTALATGQNWRQSIAITWRDGGSQPSPNSGYPEAAVAGALGIRFGGLNYYRGVPSRKAYLGDAVHRLSASQWPRVRRLLYGTSAIMILAVLAIR